MRWLSNILFYGYVGLLLIAGIWGMCFARFDHALLFDLNVQTLEQKTAASILSQYRFLRAMEFGFGMFAIVFRKEIFRVPLFNGLFLIAMFLGVVGRIISFIVDGWPYPVYYFFAISELLGVIVIFIYSGKTLERT